MIPALGRNDNCNRIIANLFWGYWCQKDAGKGEDVNFGGRYLFLAPRLEVWAALNDTEILKAAIPGCQRIDWMSETELEAAIAVNLGVMKPVFKGDLILSDVRPAERYTLTGKGRGGLLGLAHASADIALSDDPDGTDLLFTATGQASGQIMKFGRAIVGASAQKVIDRFFERIATAMDVAVSSRPQPDDPPT
jgi:uncharacterized protein